MKKQTSIFIFLISAVTALYALSACGPVTPIPSQTPTLTTTPTPTPSKTAIPRPTRTATATPYAQLEELATLGKGVLPQITRSPDGSKVFVVDGYDAQILNASDYSEINSIHLSDDGYGGITSVNDDGSLVIVSSFFGFRVIDTATGEVVGGGSGGNGSTSGEIFTPDGKYVIYSMNDRTTGGSYQEICRTELYVKTDPNTAEWPCYPSLNNFRYHYMSNPAVSPDGKLVAAGYSESTKNILFIWDLESKAILHQIEELPSHIRSVSFNANGSLLATAGGDGILRLWNPSTAELKRSIIAFEHNLSWVEFGKQSNQILVSTFDQPEFILDLDTLEKSPVTPEPMDPFADQLLAEGYLLNGGGSKIQFSPDGKTLAVGHGNIQVWDVAKKSLKAVLFADNALKIAGITYSPDGKHLGVITIDGDVYSWEIQSGKLEFSVSADTLVASQAPYESGLKDDFVPGIGAGVYGEMRIAFSPDGRQIALPNGPAIELWDVQTGSKLLVFEQTAPLSFPGKITFSEDGKRVYAALNRNRDLGIWDARTGTLISLVGLPNVDTNAFTATDMYGPWLARNNYDETENWVELWNAETGQMTEIPTYMRDVEPLRFSADGKFFAAILDHDQLYVWNAASGERIFISDNVFDIGDFAINAEGSLLATATYGQVTLWNLDPQIQMASQPGFTPPGIPPTATSWYTSSDYPTPTPQPTIFVQTLPVAPASQNALAKNNAGRVELIDEIGKGKINQIEWTQDGKKILVSSTRGFYQLEPDSLDAASAYGQNLFSVTSSRQLSNGRKLLTGQTIDKKVQVWDVGENKLLYEAPYGASPVLSPNGRWLVYVDESKGMTTWDLERGQPGPSLLSYYRLSQPIFSPNSRYVAVAQSDMSARVWDIETGIIINAIGGAEAQITELSFSPDGNYLVGAAGGTAWVWSMAPSLKPFKVDVYEGTQNDNLTLFADTVTAAALNQDNTLLAVGTTQKQILFYDRGLGKLRFTLDSLTGTPIHLQFNPDGSRLLSVDRDGRMSIWDVAQRKSIIQSHQFLAPINGMLVRSDGGISAWTENSLWQVGMKDFSVQGVTYIPAGKILAASPLGDLAAAYSAYRMSLYDAKTGDFLQTFPEEAEDVWVEYYWEGDILRQFYGASFTPDGKRLINFGTGGAWVYSIPDGTLLNHFAGNNTRKIAVSPDSEWMVFSWFEHASSPVMAGITDTDPIFSLSGGEGRRYSAYAFSPDKRWLGMLYDAWEFSEFQLWDVSTGLLSQSLKFEDTGLESLAFSPSGNLVAIGLENGDVSIIDVPTMTLVITFQAHAGQVTSVVFTKDGTYLVSAGTDGVIREWGLP